MRIPSTRMDNGQARRGARGFTLVEIMFVVAILGILAAVAIAAFTKNIRNAHKSEVISDLANISLRQRHVFNTHGHFASSTNSEDPANTYPVGSDVSDPDKLEIPWDVSDAGYTGAGLADGAYTRGGAAAHGFDVLRFLPQGAHSRCGYATISGYGTKTNDEREADEPPSGTLADAIFPDGGEVLYARDWFYSFALCDFDKDGTFGAFTTAHYTSSVSDDAIGPYQEGE
jgi:prepilin-type N-terminal cleavage/methylation domain-containing protein